MKSLFCLALVISLSAMAAPRVTNVSVIPISPMGVAIDYEVTGLGRTEDRFPLYPDVRLRNGSDESQAKSLEGDSVSKDGWHRVFWDMGKDGVPNKMKNGEISISIGGYIVIDISGGTSATHYPVTVLARKPPSGWTSEYKTTKIVLKWCPKGKDPLNRYTLTKDFYAGVFEITQKQWELVMGSNPVSGTSYGKSADRPVYYVSYNGIRGTSKGAEWPDNAEVDATSFIGKLRTKTGLDTLDLPTEAQWEYACRAGTTTTYNTGDSTSDLAAAGWYSSNSGSATHPVGQKRANAWGLYDMHGNVWEWCLDWYGANLSGTDPVGAASGSYRRRRGGSWYFNAGSCTSSYRYDYIPSFEYYYLGFRLFRTVP